MSTGKTVGLINALGGGSGGGSSLPPVTASDNGKVLAVKNDEWAAGVQEYWIPVEYSDGALRIPEGKGEEVGNALYFPDTYWVRGVKINSEFYAGYVENKYSFIVPLEKHFMENLGYDCAGKLHIAQDAGIYAVTIEPDKFIVTLTPTALDYSGTMDHTVAEINAAYEAGQEIWFRIAYNGDGYLVPMKAVYEDHETTFPSFNCEVVLGDGLDMLLYVATGSTDTGTKDTYFTSIYSLTPAS